MPCAIVPYHSFRALPGIAAVGVRVMVCSFMLVVAFCASVCVASVWTRGRVWSRDSERRVVTVLFVRSRGASTFSACRCVNGCSWWRL